MDCFERIGHDGMDFYDAFDFCAYPRNEKSKSFMDFHQNLLEVSKIRKFYSNTDPSCALKHQERGSIKAPQNYKCTLTSRSIGFGVFTLSRSLPSECCPFREGNVVPIAAEWYVGTYD